jgi:hypothetical protein
VAEPGLIITILFDISFITLLNKPRYLSFTSTRVIGTSSTCQISTASPVLAIPVSIRPVATVPRPVIVNNPQLASRKVFQYVLALQSSTAAINSRILYPAHYSIHLKQILE